MRLLLVVSLAARLSAQAPSAFEAQKARDLIGRQLPCLGCHELDGEGGRTAPSLTTVHQRRNAAYIRAIVTDPQRFVPGSGMPKTPMPASVRETVIRYLTRNAADTGAAPVAPVLTKYGRDLPVAGLYQRWCASCHGHNGSGDGPDAQYQPVPPARHSDAERMGRRTDDALFDVIAGGGVPMGQSNRMPAFGQALTPTEIRALVAFIRTKCGCVGPAWSRDGAKP